ncbi:hypothetical protein [Nakamurella endophytica]|nr:hypothetical protein [Nakamurella endophytica]
MRGADGTYRGTYSHLPHKAHARIDTGSGGYSECWAPGYEESVTGVPLL